jgi:hypothetical protein
MTLSSLVYEFQWLAGTYCFYLQGSSEPSWEKADYIREMGGMGHRQEKWPIRARNGEEEKAPGQAYCSHERRLFIGEYLNLTFLCPSLCNYHFLAYCSFIVGPSRPPVLDLLPF